MKTFSTSGDASEPPSVAMLPADASHSSEGLGAKATDGGFAWTPALWHPPTLRLRNKMANSNEIPAPTKPLMAGCQQEPCCAFVDRPEAELSHMLEVAHANGFRSITAVITFAKMARPALIRAESVLDRNKDISDAEIETVHPAIKAERLALRAVQSVLRHNEIAQTRAQKKSQ